ncbi:ARID DNA-binding domain-containing protein, partial [Phakopsora pachyrhizi]
VDGKLDFSSIRTESPRSNPRARQKDRLFELEHCPVFYPTPDEFKDPMKYFELIGSKLKSHGIGKVVPPLGWRPPFVLDTEQFKFKTRLQRLNSMEASARANTNFMEQLYLFHKQQGNSAAVVTNGSKLQVPVIDYRPVDLWKLRKQINEMGGYDNITSQRKWSSLAKAMGYNVKASPAISFKLKAAYIKIIAPFDEYVNRVKQSPTGRLFKKEERGDRPLADSLSPLTSSTADHDESEQSHINHGGTGQLEDPTKPVTRLSNGHRVSNASEDDASDNGDVSFLFRPLILNSPFFLSCRCTFLYLIFRTFSRIFQVCEVCGTDEDDSNILLCDYCDKGFHLQCLTPPLEAVPDGNWYCDACIVSTGNEFGFEEGKEHTLLSFQKRADS